MVSFRFAASGWQPINAALSKMTIEKQIEDGFLNVPPGIGSMPFYTVRTSILSAVTEASRSFHGVVLDVGCGLMPYRKLIESNPNVTRYIGMDLEKSEIYGSVKPDKNWDGSKIPLGDESIDCVMATEFLEHHAEPEKVLTEMMRVMRPHGILFATVPFIWNLHEIPHDEYRYTPYSLRRHIENAGFADVEIKALGGWNMSLAQMIGLWLSFSKMGSRRRAILKGALFPFYAWLIKTDEKPTEFDGLENSMFTGLSVTAKK